MTQPFSSIQKLSHLLLQHKNVICFPLNEVLDFEIDFLTKGAMNDKDVNKAINSILPFLVFRKVHHIDIDEMRMEKDVLHELVEKLFQYNISNSVTLEHILHHSWVKAVFKDGNTVICGNLGIGCNESTWYGTVDGRIRGHSPESSVAVIATEDDDYSSESGGASVVVGIKKKCTFIPGYRFGCLIVIHGTQFT